MKHLIRISLIPLALASFVLGYITGKWLIFGVIAIGLLVFDFVYYSGRKQRIRYWLQGYRGQLEKNGGNENDSLKSIQKEFCASKYADESVCSKEYPDVETLVLDIIKQEFKFKMLIKPSASSGSVFQNLDDYAEAVTKTKNEIENIKRELL